MSFPLGNETTSAPAGIAGGGDKTSRKESSAGRCRAIVNSSLPVAGPEAGFLGVVAEAAEAHLQQLGGLGLDAAGAVEGLHHELGADVLEMGFQVEPVLGQLDLVGVRAAMVQQLRRQVAGADGVGVRQRQRALDDVLELAA